MAEKKLTTEEILALARREGAFGSGGGGASAAPAAKAAPPVEQPAAEETLDEEPEPVATPAKPPAAKPTSTADILAVARAGAGGAAKAKPTAKQPPAAKPAAKPGSTADILAAARAGGSKGAGGKTAAKPQAEKAEKTSPKQPAAAKPGGERPSVQEMIKAAREGKPTASQAAPAKPKLPSRPPLPARKPDDSSTRRSFFASAILWITEPLMAAWAAMIALGGVWTLAGARFMMPNMIVQPPTRFKIGPSSDYPPGTVSTKWKAERGIWVVNTDQYDGRGLIYALASICTHLGCTPNWLEGEQKFKCPCHGSGFYITGVNFEGPAPRPLERVGIRVSEDGSLEVDKSVKFQEELGQWQDGASFVEVA